MANSHGFGRDPFQRFGTPGSDVNGQDGQTRNLFEKLREAPPWKLALLGGGVFAALGTAALGLLMAAGALFLLTLLFGALFGNGPAVRVPPIVQESPPPTYH